MKYIDADRLRKELDKRLKNVRDYMNGEGMKYKGPKYHKAQGKESSYDALLSIIDSLQQEQPDLPGIEESGIPGKDYIPVDWVDACEMYGKWKIVKQEQPDEDFEQNVEMEWDSFNKHLVKYDEESEEVVWLNWFSFVDIANYFYELGKNSK